MTGHVDKHLDETLEKLRDACYITDNGAFARRNIVPTCLNCIYFYISFVDLRHRYEREAHPLSDEELAHLNCRILSYAAREERGFTPYNKAHDKEHYCRHHKYSSSEYQQELEKNIIQYKLRETGDGKDYIKDTGKKEDNEMAWATDDNGEKCEYNYDENRWEYPDQDGYENIGGKKKRICQRCGKPRIDINNVEDVDFCMQALTQSDFIYASCCGHGDDDMAYIALCDGRVFKLDKQWSRR